MKYVKQFLIILAISFIGEVLSYLIPIPIPASIYGIIILLVGLITEIIPYESVKETGHFLIEIMPVMFIPAAVGLIDSWSIIKPSLVEYFIITVVTTIMVMIVAGRVTQRFTKRSSKKNDQ